MLNIEKYKRELMRGVNICKIEEIVTEITGKKICPAGVDNCDGCKELILEWLLEEAKEPILNEVEKDYLSAVIKPFRDEVKFIELPSYDRPNLTYTCIRMYDNCGNKIVRLPIFKRGTMYKGMKLDKNYTLEELGL